MSVEELIAARRLEQVPADVAAHMQAAGLRARNMQGAHEATARYAGSVLRSPSEVELHPAERVR